MAAQPKFTPGPWKLSDDPVRRVIKGVVPPERPHGGCPVSVCIIEDWTTEADARLISAAPDLYAALRNLRETAQVILDVAMDHQLDGGVHARILSDRIESATAALSKAEGRDGT